MCRGAGSADGIGAVLCALQARHCGETGFWDEEVHRCRVRNLRPSRHRALRIQQMVVAGSKPKADESARIRYGFRLPAVIGLIAAHGVFAGLIPGSRRLAAHIMLADQRFLDCLRPLRVQSSAGRARSFSSWNSFASSRASICCFESVPAAVDFGCVPAAGCDAGSSLAAEDRTRFGAGGGRLRVILLVRRLRATSLLRRGGLSSSVALGARRSAEKRLSTGHRQNAGCAQPSSYGFRA